MDEKVREQRLRRMAKRQGLVLRRSRTRVERAADYGTYGLSDGSVVVAGDLNTGFGLSLDEVEAALNE